MPRQNYDCSREGGLKTHDAASGTRFPMDAGCAAANAQRKPEADSRDYSQCAGGPIALNHSNPGRGLVSVARFEVARAMVADATSRSNGH